MQVAHSTMFRPRTKHRLVTKKRRRKTGQRSSDLETKVGTEVGTTQTARTSNENRHKRRNKPIKSRNRN